VFSFLSSYRQRRRLQHRLPEPAELQKLLAQWLQTPLGRRLLESEKAHLDPVLSRIFGYHILQISSSNEASLLTESPVGHKILFAPEYTAGIRQPVADAESLPLASGTVDAVLIHHALDFTPDSHRLLREATRVIMPGGRLLIIGFNPISVWGLRKYIHGHNRVPWNARFISSLRVTDWLKLLEFHVEKVSHGAYLLPINNAGMVAHADTFERLGGRFFNPLGAFYMIIASKQVVPVTPVVRRWPRLRAPVLVRPVAESSTLRADDNKVPRLPCQPDGNSPKSAGSRKLSLVKTR
jgi:SAM-dependent methyltransferase